MEPKITEIYTKFQAECENPNRLWRTSGIGLARSFSKIDLEEWLRTNYGMINPSSLATKCLLTWIDKKKIVQEQSRYKFIGKVKYEVVFLLNNRPVSHKDVLQCLNNTTFEKLQKITTVTTNDIEEAKKLLD